MRINKYSFQPLFKHFIVLILPIISLFFIFHSLFRSRDIIHDTVLLSAGVENPSKTLSKIKDRFSDIIINDNDPIYYPEDVNQEKSKVPFSSNINQESNLDKTDSNETNIDNNEPPTEDFCSNEPEEETIVEFVPEEYRGTIIEENFKGSASNFCININPGFLSNRTKIDSSTLKNKISNTSPLKMSIDEEPQVLLLSTHATESFEPCDRKFYDKRYNSRSTDNNKNVTQIEDQIAKQLSNSGINTIVDKTHHDFPSYNGSYNRSAVTINNYLQKYPSIKVVLDIHRDAIERDNGERVKPVVMINGKKAAQIMIISGCDDGSMNFPNWEQNLHFAVDLQKQIEDAFPGLTRPIFFCYRKYNMNLCPYSLLIEFGSNSNSLEEVKYSGELIGKALSDLLLFYKNN